MATLRITLHNAILTHDTQIGSLMDPFVIFKINKQIKKSSLLQEAGDMPIWDQFFQFSNIKNDDILQVFIYDEDVTYDDLVGEVKIPINKILSQSKTQSKWYSISFEKKPAGKVKLAFQNVSYQQFVSNQSNNYIQRVFPARQIANFAVSPNRQVTINRSLLLNPNAYENRYNNGFEYIQEQKVFVNNYNFNKRYGTNERQQSYRQIIHKPNYVQQQLKNQTMQFPINSPKQWNKGRTNVVFVKRN